MPDARSVVQQDGCPAPNDDRVGAERGLERVGFDRRLPRRLTEGPAPRVECDRSDGPSG